MILHHRYRIESSFAPADLLMLLTHACATAVGKKNKARFEFDWLKRKVEIAGADREATHASAIWLMDKVKARTGGEYLLPRGPLDQNGEFVVVFGVLLQTPDAYIDMLARFLSEAGVTAFNVGEHDDFSVLVNAPTRALRYREIIEGFPLPSYLKLIDEGTS